MERLVKRCLGEVDAPMPAAYQEAQLVLTLTRSGISLTEAEEMDPYLLAGIVDLLDAEGRAQAQRLREMRHGH